MELPTLQRGPEAAVEAAASAVPTPAEELATFVCAAAALFYSAEEGHNPSVSSYADAVHYVATSLSVGYANIFPTTEMGKLIGALVQMVGPALSARALDRPG